MRKEECVVDADNRSVAWTVGTTEEELLQMLTEHKDWRIVVLNLENGKIEGVVEYD